MACDGRRRMSDDVCCITLVVEERAIRLIAWRRRKRSGDRGRRVAADSICGMGGGLLLLQRVPRWADVRSSLPAPYCEFFFFLVVRPALRACTEYSVGTKVPR